MLKDLHAKDQEDRKPENRNPTGEKSSASPSEPPHKDDREFDPATNDDVEEIDDNDDDGQSEMERVLRPFLGLQRQLGQREKGAGVASKYDNLHPFTQILGPSNANACVALENATFPEHERCSKEKVGRCPSYQPMQCKYP